MGAAPNRLVGLAFYTMNIFPQNANTAKLAFVPVNPVENPMVSEEKVLEAKPDKPLDEPSFYRPICLSIILANYSKE